MIKGLYKERDKMTKQSEKIDHNNPELLSEIADMCDYIDEVKTYTRYFDDEYKQLVDLRLKGYTYEKIALESNFSRITVIRKLNKFENSLMNSYNQL